MRITQVMMTKGFGGAERSFVDTVLALAERGHQVQAICQPNFVKRHLLEGHTNISLSCVKQSGWWDELAASRIRRAVIDFQPSIVHVHLARGAWLAGRAVQRLEVPLVCKLHNYANLAYYKYIDHFIGTTEDQRRYLQENGYSDDRISVIPNFSRLMPVETAPIAEECTKTSPCTFITCGRLNQVKGFDILLRAFHHALEHNKNLRLIIGGEGEEKPLLQKIIEDLKLQNHVELAGWIDDLPQFLDRGNVYVVSSRSESFGIALLEAMSRGLPVISTRTKGPSHILTDENAWFTEIEDEFSLSEAILSAASQRELRQKRGEEMVQIYRTRYFEESVLGRFEELYQRLSEHHSIPAGYVGHDSSQMVIHRDSQQILRQFGIETAAQAMSIPFSEVLRNVDGRQTGTLECRDISTGGVQRIYLKRHVATGSTSSNYLKDAQSEFAAILKCEQAGIPTMQVLACGSHQNAEHGPVGSFLITSEAGGGVSADQLSHTWRSDPAHRSHSATMRHDIIVAVAETARKLHASGLYHQDFYWSHFFPWSREDGKVVASLIDVQRLTSQKTVLSRLKYQLKDLAQLRYAMEWVGLTSDEIQFFYRQYFQSHQKASSGTRFRFVMPIVVWLRSAGRISKLKARRKQRGLQKTIEIELGPALYSQEIPKVSIVDLKKSQKAA